MPYVVKTDTLYGNRYLYAEIHGAVEDTLSVIVQFDVTRQERGVLPGRPPSEMDLQANKLVPVNDFFRTVVSENNLSGIADSTAIKIYDFILNSMTYAKPKKPEDAAAKEYPAAFERYQEGIGWGRGDALYACEIGVGNCTDFHSYFMSLCRSAGIPARFDMGFPIPETDNGEISGYHCWAEFYVPQKGWSPVDISEADKHPARQNYYFGTLDPDRIMFTTGRDIPLDQLSTGTTNYFIYPIVEVDGNPSIAFNKKFTFKLNHNRKGK